MNSILVFR